MALVQCVVVFCSLISNGSLLCAQPDILTAKQSTISNLLQNINYRVSSRCRSLNLRVKEALLNLEASRLMETKGGQRLSPTADRK